MAWDDKAKFVLELFEDDAIDTKRQLWEIECKGLGLDSYRHLPDFLIPNSQIKVLHNHPLLWNYADEILFSLTTTTDNVSSLVGDLFIEHSKACGNWIDFHWLYRGLAETLSTMRDNQLGIPAPLEKACFTVLDLYNVRHSVNEVQKGEEGYHVLFFSKSVFWPDEENFGQPYIVAKKFSERRIS